MSRQNSHPPIPTSPTTLNDVRQPTIILLYQHQPPWSGILSGVNGPDRPARGSRTNNCRLREINCYLCPEGSCSSLKAATTAFLFTRHKLCGRPLSGRRPILTSDPCHTYAHTSVVSRAIGTGPRGVGGEIGEEYPKSEIDLSRGEVNRLF